MTIVSNYTTTTAAGAGVHARAEALLAQLAQLIDEMIRPTEIDVRRVLEEAHADGVRIWFDDHQRLCFHALAAAHEKWAKQISDNRGRHRDRFSGTYRSGGVQFREAGS